MSLRSCLAPLLSWSSESEEVIDFRRAMRSLRPTSQAEYDALKVHRQLRTYIDKTPSSRDSPTNLPPQDLSEGIRYDKGMLVTRIRRSSSYATSHTTTM